MTPSQEKQIYDLDKSLWSVTRVLKHCPQYRKQLWDLLTDDDQRALRAVVASDKDKIREAVSKPSK